MSAFLVYHRTTRPTGRLLARALGIPCGYASRAARQGRSEVLIRWGTQQNEGLWDNQYRYVLNEPYALARASNKLNALRCFGAEGVPAPAFATDFPSTGVWLGRNLRGYGGLDIIPLRDGISLHPRGIDGEPAFYTKFIPNDREYRIHVYNGEVIRVQRKYLEVPEDRTSEYIKNYANGYRFKAPQRRLNNSRLDAATRAVEALGLTFGAVDLIVDHEGREYVLEVNTAPKCSPLTARAYVDAIATHLGDLGVSVTPDYTVLGGLDAASE